MPCFFPTQVLVLSTNKKTPDFPHHLLDDAQQWEAGGSCSQLSECLFSLLSVGLTCVFCFFALFFARGLLCILLTKLAKLCKMTIDCCTVGGVNTFVAYASAGNGYPQLWLATVESDGCRDEVCDDTGVADEVFSKFLAKDRTLFSLDTRLPFVVSTPAYRDGI